MLKTINLNIIKSINPQSAAHHNLIVYNISKLADNITINKDKNDISLAVYPEIRPYYIINLYLSFDIFFKYLSLISV